MLSVAVTYTAGSRNVVVQQPLSAGSVDLGCKVFDYSVPRKWNGMCCLTMTVRGLLF